MPEPDGKLGTDGIGLGLGERLRSARKGRALSLEQVAESLHLDETVILALENERFEEFGAPVFVRGHLKAYARLVGLPVDSVLEAYRQADPEIDEVPVVARAMTDRSVSINPVTWGFWGLVIIVGLTLAVYVLQEEPVTPAYQAPLPEAADVPQEPAAESFGPTEIEAEFQDLPGDPQSASVVEDEPAEFAVSVAEAQAVVEAVESPVVQPEPVDTTLRLSLYFRQESWVEISDANRRLLFGLQPEGRRRRLAGEPPIRLILGNGQGVDLEVDGEPYSFPVAGPGRVTRFEINAATQD